jgi:hypothetical protein
VGPRADLDEEARRKILCLCRGSNPGRPVRSQDTILTELPRLLDSNKRRVIIQTGYIQLTIRTSGRFLNTDLRVTGGEFLD